MQQNMSLAIVASKIFAKFTLFYEVSEAYLFK
jgi:hypothetical protein